MLIGLLGCKELFSQVSSHEGPILASVYPWYTDTEHNGRKDKMNSFTQTRKFNLLYT